MDLTPYVASLHTALTNAARTSSTEVQEAADRLAQGVEPALRLTLMEMASDLAADVTSRLDGDVVDVRIRGGNPEIVVERRAPEPDVPTAPLPPPPPPAPAPEDDGGTARISLRIPEYLKTQLEEAAAADGVSVNTWLVRCVATSLQHGGQPQHGIDITTPGGRVRIGRNLSGWVR